MPTRNAAPQKPEPAPIDPLIWMERAQAMLVYSNSLKDADEKVLKLFDSVTEQTKHYYEISARVYQVGVWVVIATLLFGLITAIFSKGEPFWQNLSLLSFCGGILLLIVLLFRNPLKQARQMLENTVRLNVVFLSFVRRLQQSDLALRFVFMQNQTGDFKKLYAQIQEFQNMVDQTSEEIAQILQDFGD